MPGFSDIAGNLAKAAFDQFSNRNQGSQNSGYNSNSGQPNYNNQPYNSGQPNYNSQSSSYNQSNYNYQPFQSQPNNDSMYPNQQQPYSGMPSAPSAYNYNYNQHPQSNIGFNTGSNALYGQNTPYPPTSAPYPGPNSSYGQSMPLPPTSNAPYGQTPYPGSNVPYGQNPPYGQPSQYSSSNPPYSQPNPPYSQSNQFGGGYSQQPQNFYGQRQPAMYSNPSIKPYPHFNANHDADALRNAMKGLGCNNNRVIEILCQRSNAQRQDIARVFKTMYGKDLIKELKSELRGDFEELILALMENPVAYDAQQLYKAMARIGTKEHVLIEIMTSRTNAQIFQLKQAYAQIYGRDLEQHLVSETSGYFKRLLVSMCAGGRDEGTQTDPLRANQDARKLYQSGEQRLGTDEAQFNAILAQQNFLQLRLVFDEYQRSTGHSIEQAINAEFSGDIRDAHLALIKAIRNRPAYFAELLYNSMKGFGTRDTDLIRIIVTRSEVDLADIRQEYQRMYGTSLENAIAGDCSGAYKDGLITLVKGN